MYIYTHTHKYVFRSSQVLWTAFKVVPRRRVYRFSAEVRILTPAEESSACELDGYGTKEIREPLRDCEIVVEFGGFNSFCFWAPDGIRRKKKPSRGFDEASLLGARSEVYMTKNKVGCFNIYRVSGWSHGDLEVTPKMVQMVQLSGGDVLLFGGLTCWKKAQLFTPPDTFFPLFFGKWTASQGFSMVHCCADLHLLLHHAVLTWEFTLNDIWSGTCLIGAKYLARSKTKQKCSVEIFAFHAYHTLTFSNILRI